jgi:hypothetical protein
MTSGAVAGSGGSPGGSDFQRTPNRLCNLLVADLAGRSRARFIEQPIKA